MLRREELKESVVIAIKIEIALIKGLVWFGLVWFGLVWLVGLVGLVWF